MRETGDPVQDLSNGRTRFPYPSPAKMVPSPGLRRNEAGIQIRLLWMGRLLTIDLIAFSQFGKILTFHITLHIAMNSLEWTHFH